jgi:hypothetical protein
MNFLKQIANFLTARPMPMGSDVGLYYYVKCNRCGEIIKVRINPMNDLSRSDDDSTLFVRKVIVGRKCYNRIDAEFTYNSARKLMNTEISGGDLVDERDYDEQQAADQAAIQGGG